MQTQTYFPRESHLSFDKHKAFIEAGITLFADIETCHTPLEGVLCCICR